MRWRGSGSKSSSFAAKLRPGLLELFKPSEGFAFLHLNLRRKWTMNQRSASMKTTWYNSRAHLIMLAITLFTSHQQYHTRRWCTWRDVYWIVHSVSLVTQSHSCTTRQLYCLLSQAVFWIEATLVTLLNIHSHEPCQANGRQSRH